MSNGYVDTNALLQILSAYAPVNQNTLVTPLSIPSEQYLTNSSSQGAGSYAPAGYDPTMPALGLPVTQYPTIEQASSTLHGGSTDMMTAVPQPGIQYPSYNTILGYQAQKGAPFVSGNMSGNQTLSHAQFPPAQMDPVPVQQQMSHSQSTRSFNRSQAAEIQKQEPLGPDPRTITEWPVALRYVTKLANKNLDLGNSIRKVKVL